MLASQYSDMLSRLMRDGFLYVDEIATMDELDKLEKTIDGLFAHQMESASSFTRILSRSGNTQTLEINNTLYLEPTLENFSIYQRILAISRHLCGPRVGYIHDHAIYKGPGGGSPTPWHQDAAISLGRLFYSHRLHWWIPFQATTPDTGSLQFARGSHKGKIYPHYLKEPSGNIDRMIRRDINPASIHKLIFQPGSASVHLSRTLHCAGSNHGAMTRKAWVLQFGIFRPNFMRKPIIGYKRLFGQFGYLRRRT